MLSRHTHRTYMSKLRRVQETGGINEQGRRELVHVIFIKELGEKIQAKLTDLRDEQDWHSTFFLLFYEIG